MKTIISTSSAPAAVGPYSQAVLCNGFLFCSGQIALTPEGTMMNGDAAIQTEQIMQNIQAVLGAADLTFDNIVKTTIYLTDISDFGVVNEMYASYFTSDPPARSTVAVAALPLGARVEIEVLARKL